VIQTILLFTLRPGVTDEQIEALRADVLAPLSSAGNAARSGSEPGHGGLP
jgi:hypothetical protein